MEHAGKQKSIYSNFSGVRPKFDEYFLVKPKSNKNYLNLKFYFKYSWSKREKLFEFETRYEVSSPLVYFIVEKLRVTYVAVELQYMSMIITAYNAHFS